jgi:hypothetical protein
MASDAVEANSTNRLGGSEQHWAADNSEERLEKSRSAHGVVDVGPPGR